MDRSCRPSHQRNVVPTLPVRDRHTTCAGCLVLPVRLAFLLAGALMAGCSGSGPERYEVSGSVTFAGAKVAEGTIALVPIENTEGPKVGTNIQQGQYHIDRSGRPVAGRHRVEISSFRKTGEQVANMGGQMIDNKANELPPKYSGKTSELVVEIKTRGKNVFDFDLKVP